MDFRVLKVTRFFRDDQGNDPPIKPRACCWRLALSTLGFGLACLAAGCGKVSDPVECWEGAATGSWTKLAYPPEHLGGDPGVSDGATFSLILRHPVCASCTLGELDTENLSWTTYETSGLDLEFNAGKLQLAEDYLGATDFSGSAYGLPTSLRTFATLDRETREWSTSEPPEEYKVRWEYDLRWTGSVFLIWGGYVATGGEIAFYEDTALQSFSDGVTYDPSTGVWNLVPPAWPIGDHVYGEHPPQGQMSSVWTPEGLFVWGSNPDETDAALAIYDLNKGEWSYPLPETSPALRRYHELSYHDGFVYLVGGFHIDSNPSDPNGPRELWRFSLENLEWEELKVPKFADLEVAKGSWLGDRLLLLGHRCASGSAFDAKDGTWEPISGENRPPLSANVVASVGELAAAGESLVVNAVSSDGFFENSSVWIFEF